jgi:hypothetical protein
MQALARFSRQRLHDFSVEPFPLLMSKVLDKYKRDRGFLVHDVAETCAEFDELSVRDIAPRTHFERPINTSIAS